MFRFVSIAVLAFVLSVPVPPTFAQDENQGPCSLPESTQLDFWVGEWDLTWDGGSGTNTIRRILDGCVVEENFAGDMGESGMFYGQSYSVYNPNIQKWQQTWVDNQGGYLDFVGGFADGEMILAREASRGGKKFFQRMIFQNIERDSLDWSWQRSDDEGKSWTDLWVIHYARKKD